MKSGNITNQIYIEYKWVIEEITSVEILFPLLFMKLEICSQRNLLKAVIDINEQSGCDEKDDDVPEDVTPVKNFTIMELSEIL